MENEDVIILWEAPKIEKPEFRLYHDSLGKVVCYTCDKLEGDYIVIDAVAFAEARPDVRVINGILVRDNPQKIVCKLTPNHKGTPCHSEDVSIVVDQDYKDIQHWEMLVHEL